MDTINISKLTIGNMLILSKIIDYDKISVFLNMKIKQSFSEG